MSWEKLAPHLNPHIGCLNCGGKEMIKKDDKIIASLRTRIYNSFGGWTIICDGDRIYQGEIDLEFEEYPTLMKFELMARKNPDHDWRAECMLPLRDAIYQRQGKNEWVLVGSGLGFA